MPKLEPLNAEQQATTTSSATAVLESEDLDPDQTQQSLRPRDRSPHPYLYHTEELRALRNAATSASTTWAPQGDPLQPGDRATPIARSPTSPSTTSSLPTPELHGVTESKPPFADSDGRARRRTAYRSSTTATGGSESGTEADDEATTFVKALPAPALRPRKGLRGASSDDVGAGLEELDALMTPAYLEKKVGKRGGYFGSVLLEAGGRGEGGREGRGREKSEGKPGVERFDKEEVERKWEEFKKKRKAELLRRVSETMLLMTIGLAAVNGRGVWSKVWEWHRAELGAHLAIFVVLCAVYPLRLIKYSLERALEERGPRRYGIRVPSAFDPATLLYPCFLPVLVALSLSSTSPELILPNVVLGLSALPTRLIFKFGTPMGYDCLHWLLAILPLFASQWTAWPSKLFPPKPYGLKTPPPIGLDPETIICLFPLQYALLPPLRFLTTTSLLPAELQLLATALINLWLFARSPQATILSVLLLPGGLSLFLLCRHFLQWNVALARIPKWRLKRAGHIVIARNSFLDALTARLKSNGGLTSFSNSTGGNPGSDADEDGHLLDNVKSKTPRSRLRALTTQLSNSADHTDGTQSAIEPPCQTPIPLDANGAAYDRHQISPRKRRYTLSHVSDVQPHLQPPEIPEKGATQQTSSITKPPKRRRSDSLTRSYLSLTPKEATTRRWLYAGYTYIIMLLIILIPLRSYIGTHALNGCEPFGWALGYLFGDIPYFRNFTLSYHLDSWIPLPPSAFPQSNLSLTELPSHLLHQLHTIPLFSLRDTVFGPATTRLLITTYWILILALGISTVLLLPRLTHIEVDTRRKIFHGTVVIILLPTIPLDPCFVALTLALVLAVFLLLDLLRAAQVQPIAAPLARFLQPYVDGRDLRGPVVVSHMFLLVGCAIPLWLSLAGAHRGGEGPWKGWETDVRDVSMVAGVVCVGMGDAAASLVGRRFGRRKWPWTGGKSLEGSAAFAVAVTAGLLFGRFWLQFGGWQEDGMMGLVEEWASVGIKAMLAACGASFMEAVLTGGNDNVIVPVVLWLLVRGARL